MRGWLLVAVLLLSACAGRTGLDSGAGKRSADDDIAAALRGADIAILGEVHDNAEHHQNQARLIRALSPAAVVFEMLSPEQAATANATRDRGDGLRAALAWDDSGWPDWALYQPVFEAVGDTPIYGMALPRETVSRAVTAGAAEVFGASADAFGLAEPLPPEQQQVREAHQQEAHCNMLPESLLPGMVEAQRLRDAAFARTTLRALKDTGGPVVVITGSGHARTDWGMPVALKRAAPAARVLSLGQLEADSGQEPREESENGMREEPPCDVWLVTAPAPRNDPCAGFRMPGAVTKG